MCLFLLRLLWISGALWLYFCVCVFVALCFLIRMFSPLSLSLFLSPLPPPPLSTTEVVLMWSAAVVNDMFAYLYEICLVSARPSFFFLSFFFFSFSPLWCVKRHRREKKRHLCETCFDSVQVKGSAQALRAYNSVSQKAKATSDYKLFRLCAVLCFVLISFFFFLYLSSVRPEHFNTLMSPCCSLFLGVKAAIEATVFFFFYGVSTQVA